MEPVKDTGIGCRDIRKLALLALMAFVVAGCGGGGGDDGYHIAAESPPITKISAFKVDGNDSPVNGREQIVAGTNNGMFRMSLNVAPAYSGDAKVWISDRENLGTTNLEQEIVHLQCSYHPLCSFDLTVNCSFSVSNRVSCQVGSGGSGPIQAEFPAAVITPLPSSNQADLFIVLDVQADGTVSAQRIVPVEFRN